MAAFLSFVVVYLWSGVFNPGQKESLPVPSQNQTVSPETSAQKAQMPAPDADSTKPVPSPSQNADEKITTAENDKFLLDFSNIGGVLKSVHLKEYDATIPITNVLAVNQYRTQAFQLESASDEQVTYSLNAGEYTIYKQYFFNPNDYTIKANIRVKNETEMSKIKNLDIQAYLIDMSSLDNKEEKNRSKLRSRSLLEYVVYAEDKMHRKNNAYKFKDKEYKESQVNVNWIGFRTRYYCSIIKPQYQTGGYIINPQGEKKLNILIRSPNLQIPGQGSVDLSFLVFSGPEKKSLLKTYEQDFERIKRYYKNGLLDAMGKLMNAILHLLHKVIPNWGVCIMFMAVIVYFTMYPLTMRGMLSMRKMQSLQPEIVKIKDKYKNDQQKANMEVMELYKKHKINPLGGCLPMLLQMPVFIGLYQVLWRSVYFNGTSFLWIDNLSQPDRLFKLPFTIPFINSQYFNLLPILMMIIMFFQQKLSARNMVMSDPAQKSQQKMMSTIMPLFLGFIFYTFASGLTLYFTMFYLFSSFTQWKMSQKGKGK